MPNSPLKNDDNADQPIDLVQYLHVALKYKWLVVFCVVATTSLALLHNSRLTPLYEAAATVLIENKAPRILLPNSAHQYQNYISELFAFNTHIQLISSREVLAEVARRLNLHKLDQAKETHRLREPGQFERYVLQFKENTRRLLGEGPEQRTPVASAPTEEEQLAQMALVLKSKIRVERVEETFLLRIHAINVTDPAMARDLANAAAETYIEFNAKNRLESTRDTLEWLTDQLSEMKQKLESAEAEFLGYKQSVALVSVADRQKMIGQKISDFNDSYLQARNRRLEVEAKLEQLERMSKSREDLPMVRSLIGNDLIESLYAQLLESQVTLSQLKKTYKAKHPKMIQAEDRIRDLRLKLEHEIKKEKGNLEAERSLLASREDVLQKTIRDFEREAMATNEKELQSTILERNVENYQRIYNTLLGQIKEADLSENADTSTIRVVEAAIVPGGPVGPNKNRNLGMAVIMGVMVGLCLGFMAEYMDRTFRTEDQIEKFLGIPVLAVIPDGEKGGGGYGYGEVAKGNKNGSGPDTGKSMVGRPEQKAAKA